MEATSSAPLDECKGWAWSKRLRVSGAEDTQCMVQQEGDKEVSEIAKYLETGELPKGES